MLVFNMVLFVKPESYQQVDLSTNISVSTNQVDPSYSVLYMVPEIRSESSMQSIKAS